MNLDKQYFLKGQSNLQSYFYILSEQSYQQICQYIYGKSKDPPQSVNYSIIKNVNMIGKIEYEPQLIKEASFDNPDPSHRIRVIDERKNKYIFDELKCLGVSILRRIAFDKKTGDQIFELRPRIVKIKFMNASFFEQILNKAEDKYKIKQPEYLKIEAAIFQSQNISYFQRRVSQKLAQIIKKKFDLRMYILDPLLYKRWSFWKSIHFYLIKDDLKYFIDKQQQNFYQNILRNRQNDSFLAETFPGEMLIKQTYKLSSFAASARIDDYTMIAEYKTKDDTKWVFPEQPITSVAASCAHCLLTIQLYLNFKCPCEPQHCKKQLKFCTRVCMHHGLRELIKICPIAKKYYEDFCDQQKKKGPYNRFNLSSTQLTQTSTQKKTQITVNKSDNRQNKRVQKNDQCFIEKEDPMKHITVYNYNNQGRGLKNVGNTCYMNSSLQCLSQSILFASELLNLKSKKIGQFTMAFINLLHEMRKPNNYAISQQEMQAYKITLCNYLNRYNGQNQHDAHEFLSEFMQKIHDQLNIKKNSIEMEMEESEIANTNEISDHEWNKFIKKNKSPIIDYFYGQTRTEVKCPQCNHIQLRFSPINSLSVSIPAATISVYFQYANFKLKTFYFMLKCKTNNPKEIIDQIAQKLKFSLAQRQNLRLFMLGFNGPSYEIEPIDEISDLQQQKNVNESDQERQLFVLQRTYKSRKSVLYFKFLDANDKPFSFKKPFFFQKNMYELTGLDLYLAIGNYLTGLINLYQRISYKEFQKNISQRPQDYFVLKIQLYDKKIHSNSVIFEGDPITIGPQEILNGILTEEFQGQIWIHLTKLFQTEQNLIYKQIVEKMAVFKKFEKSSPSDVLNSQYMIENLIQQEYTKEIRLPRGEEWQCHNCQRKVRALQKSKIEKAPKYLIVQIKRFKLNCLKNQYERNEQKIRIATELNLSKVVFNPNQNKQLIIQAQPSKIDIETYDMDMETSDRVQYRLYGIITHKGKLNSGHYQAYTCSGVGWCHFNDEQVKSKDISKLLTSEELMKEFYILFYERRGDQFKYN